MTNTDQSRRCTFCTLCTFSRGAKFTESFMWDLNIGYIWKYFLNSRVRFLSPNTLSDICITGVQHTQHLKPLAFASSMGWVSNRKFAKKVDKTLPPAATIKLSFHWSVSFLIMNLSLSISNYWRGTFDNIAVDRSPELFFGPLIEVLPMNYAHLFEESWLATFACS